MTLSAFIHVQHLLGTGHAVRAAAIGKALAARGIEVTLATGNLLPPTLDTSGLEVVQLPPVKSPDAVFNRLVTLDGDPIDGIWEEQRTAATLKAFTAKPYDLLLTETYPFGRRQFEFELSALIATAKEQDRPPLIATSIRDILVRKQELWKEEWMADQACAHYDRILIHSDPDFVQLADSFPFADKVEHLVRYTGFVGGGARPEPPEGLGEDEVIVSCGGGAVAQGLLMAALEARPLSRRAEDATWRILVGHDNSDMAFETYARSAGEGIIVERARKDFPGLLKRARLSVSQAGYNTVLDVLIAGVPAVFVPFAQVKETEQTQRANALAAHGRAVVTPEHDLSPEKLAAAIDDALALPRRHHEVLLGGAEKSAEILLDDLKARLS
ncbi:glycosyltransferase family protein [Roseibium sp.]|uniref:glycosyltransferase family protein n=1 Tax=Roseibium sp. TaxID=1936156 RepID=UPI003A9791FA